MDRHRVVVVIPALNEAATIASVVMAVHPYAVPVVVDDGSSDNTAELASGAGAAVVSHAQNLGYDSALNSGFRAAASMGVDYVLTLDADGQHHPELVAAFVQALQEGVDLVVGVRSEQQRLMERVFSRWTRRRYGINDPLCGLKGYRVARYLEVGHFDSYRSIGTELMLRLVRRGCAYRQIPFTVGSRADAARFGSGLRPNLRILRALAIGWWRDLGGMASP